MNALLLVGGGSQRMGRDKALLEIKGRFLWERQLDLLSAMCPSAVAVAAPEKPAWLPSGIPFVEDEAAAGPMGGVLAGLAWSPDKLLVLAVDMPGMTLPCLNALTETSAGETGMVPVLDGQREPLAAIYPKAALDSGRQHAANVDLALHRWIAALESENLMRQWVVPAEFSACFQNTNTPQEWAQYQ